MTLRQIYEQCRSPFSAIAKPDGAQVARTEKPVAAMGALCMGPQRAALVAMLVACPLSCG